MLSVAEAFSKMKKKPKRSMIFLAVTGEEYGLYGSKYWADNPTWDLSKIAGNLNLDGIGTEVYGPVKNMVGFGAEHSTLGAMLEDVAKSYGVKLMPDPQPEEKVFTRSDHYSFVKKGVPALMLMGAPEGTKEELIAKIKAWEKMNYHQPTDDVMKDWYWKGAKTVADMMGILGLRISNQEKAPEWLSSSEYSKIKR
jgi:Zn-dependent M28 family amino/carboxypeptidase